MLANILEIFEVFNGLLNAFKYLVMLTVFIISLILLILGFASIRWGRALWKKSRFYNPLRIDTEDESEDKWIGAIILWGSFFFVLIIFIKMVWFGD